MAFPAVSAGIYGWPPTPDAARIALAAIGDAGRLNRRAAGLGCAGRRRGEDTGVPGITPLPRDTGELRPVPAWPPGVRAGRAVLQAVLERVPVRAAAVSGAGDRAGGPGREPLS